MGSTTGNVKIDLFVDVINALTALTPYVKYAEVWNSNEEFVTEFKQKGYPQAYYELVSIDWVDSSSLGTNQSNPQSGFLTFKVHVLTSSEKANYKTTIDVYNTMNRVTEAITSLMVKGCGAITRVDESTDTNYDSLSDNRITFKCEVEEKAHGTEYEVVTGGNLQYTILLKNYMEYFEGGYMQNFEDGEPFEYFMN